MKTIQSNEEIRESVAEEIISLAGMIPGFFSGLGVPHQFTDSDLTQIKLESAELVLRMKGLAETSAPAQPAKLSELVNLQQHFGGAR